MRISISEMVADRFESVVILTEILRFFYLAIKNTSSVNNCLLVLKGLFRNYLSTVVSNIKKFSVMLL